MDGVLKVLKQQGDSERRARMHREAIALGTLTHDGLAPLLDHNTAEYKNATPLYLVTQYIPGPTLASRISSAPLDLAEAVGLADRLLDVLAYCHARDVLHRDIKPDNIILRHSQPAEAVLLDFGLCFNAAVQEEFATAPSQQLGNRFYALPELRSRDDDKRNNVSDLTMVAAILYFALIGVSPTLPLDATGRQPHQRLEAAERLRLLPSTAKSALLSLFDRAFEIPVSSRIQTVDAFRMALQSVSSPSPMPTSESHADILQHLRARLVDVPEVKNRAQAEAYFTSAHRACSSVITELVQALDNHFQVGGSQITPDLPHLSYAVKVQLTHRYLSDKRYMVKVFMQLSGSELVVHEGGTGALLPLARLPLVRPLEVGELKIALRSHLLRVLSSL